MNINIALPDKDSSKKIYQAVANVVKKGKNVTYDLKENRNDSSAVGTKEMADAMIKIHTMTLENWRKNTINAVYSRFFSSSLGPNFLRYLLAS